MNDTTQASSSSPTPSPTSDVPGASPKPSQQQRLSSVLKRAQASLRQTIKRYSTDPQKGESTPLQADVQQQLEQVSRDLNKLEQGVLRIAVFGMVSRGKSSVINALVQQDVLKTGVLHGVTKWPRSVYWDPQPQSSNLRVELIDTPGLDEVGGAIRGEMAQDVAQEADLILFVLAGDITSVEYQALAHLLQQQKPLMIVCNKMDRYPDQDSQTVLQQLSQVLPNAQERLGRTWQLTEDDIVQVAAAPASVQVRIEWPDGSVTHEWEAPPPQMEALRQRLHHILERDGPFLIALNALRDSQATEATIAATAMQIHDQQAEELLWQFAKWKGLAVAANPLALADLAGGAIADLVMIRSLARLYGLPMTGYDAGQLWKAIVWSSGGLLLGEVGSGVVLGVGKSAAVLTGVLGGVATYSTTAIAQATLAGYGSYRVGKAAQIYLQKGCSWGPYGASTVIKTMLEQTDGTAIMARLRKEWTPTES